MDGLKTKRVELRCFKKSDYISIADLMCDPDIMKFTGFKNPQSTQIIKEYLNKWIDEPKSHLGTWAAEYLDSREFVGWFMLKKTISESPELGFMVSKKYWNIGIATEISSLIIKNAFNNHSEEKIIASTTRENIPSIKVLTKLGFVRSLLKTDDENIIYFEVKNTSSEDKPQAK